MTATRRHEIALACLIAFEIGLFASIAASFFSIANFFECIRLAVEIGLISLAMLAVILTGGIDLSVGSMMGLSAVVFGMLWHDAGWPVPFAAALALAVGALGGLINASLIARFHVSPLIVTLGTYSLFRGIAEGMTGAARGFSGFPARFLSLGQGYLGGAIPVQGLVLAAAILFWGILIHRTIVGRALYATGLSPAATLHAGVPVARRLTLVYVSSGLAASAAALIYVARIGQAKSDAGAGYELAAITAVVLGGTSISGGAGSVWGTLLGVASIVLLRNGLRLAAMPAELAGIATGLALLLTMRRSRIAIAICAGLALALFAAGRNWSASSQVTVAMMPKSKGDPYFISCRAGAGEAAKEDGVNLIWDGPTEVDPAKQNEFVESWITRRVDAIAVSVGSSASISTILRRARAHGIKVLTWDADAEPDSRDYFINQARPEDIAATLIDRAAAILHGRGEIAIITGALSAANQNLWIHFMRERLATSYRGITLAVIRPSDDDRDKAFAETQTIMKVYPGVRVIVAISAPAVPGAAEAVKQSGRTDVLVTGLSLPNLSKPYIHAGVLESVVLWKTRDLGYLTVKASAALARGQFPLGSTSWHAGKLGEVRIQGRDIILGKPFTFTKENIDQF